MPYIEVDKENTMPIELYYEDYGSGDPVLLIHGFPFDGPSAWEKQSMALLDAGYRVITYDRRGFGKSSRPSVGYDYDTFVADLDKFLTALDLTNVVLVGHSMGTGEVTHYLGTKGSDRISKGVLISPIPPFLLKTDEHPNGADQALFDGIQQAILDDRLAYLRENFIYNFYNLDENLGKLVSQEVVDANWNTASIASPKGTYDCVQAWLTDFRADLPKLDVPILVIQGTADRILPYELTGSLLPDLIADCKLVPLEGAPHGIPWTHANEVNKAILEFI